MKIIDSSTLIYCFVNGIDLPGTFYVIGDLDEEFEMAEPMHKKKRTNVLQASEIRDYSEAYYLRQYAVMLEQHAGFSLSGMRGLGDIAILALVKSYQDNFGVANQISLGLFDDEPDQITVITNDAGLKKRLIKEFNGTITIQTSADL